MSDAEAVAAEISQGPTREVLQLQYQFAHLLRQFDQEQDARDLAAARANLRMRAIIKQRVDSRQRKHNAWNKFRRLVRHVQLFASFLNTLYTEVRYDRGVPGHSKPRKNSPPPHRARDRACSIPNLSASESRHIT